MSEVGATDQVEDFFVWSADEAKISYQSEKMLAIKQEIHKRYRTNNSTLPQHVARCLGEFHPISILDVGCGNMYLLVEVLRSLSRPPERVVGLDVSEGVLRDAQHRLARVSMVSHVDLVCGNVDDCIATADSKFDCVMANYMFHYIVDQQAALNEVRRVLAGRGAFLVSTDSKYTMPELYDIHLASMRELEFPDRLIKRTPKVRFSIENGFDILSGAFESVTFVPYVDSLRFESLEPLMLFYCEGNNFLGARTVAGDEASVEMFVRLRERVENAVAAILERDGAFVITKRTGTFVCK